MSWRAGTGSWTEPGVFKVAEGIHRIPLPMRDDGLRGVNVYAIEDGDGVTLVDGGWAIPEAYDVLVEQLGVLGYLPSDISRVLVTHGHVDHYTLACWLRAEFGVQVAVGEHERPSITWLASDQPRHRFQAALLEAAGAPELAAFMTGRDEGVDPVAEGWELPDVWLAEGELTVGRRQVQVLHTPGHTQGHVVLWVPEEGLLFSGDQVLPHITPSVGFESMPEARPLVSFLASLGRLRSLPDARLLPAHGPADARTHVRIDELVEHHQVRLRETEEALAALRSGTAAEVTAALTWTRHRRAYAELDSFNQALAVTETVAHLGYLVHQQVLTQSSDAVALYAVA